MKAETQSARAIQLINQHPDTSADVLCANGVLVVADCGCHALSIANARLIAAAPDLLAACQRTVRMLEQQQDGSDPVLVSTLRQVRAAIAKAEGR